MALEEQSAGAPAGAGPELKHRLSSALLEFTSRLANSDSGALVQVGEPPPAARAKAACATEADVDPPAALGARRCGCRRSAPMEASC
jgi:hypothetical protein